MKLLKIYWTNVEYSLSENHTECGKFKGGMVFAFVKSHDSESALLKFRNAFDKQYLIPFDYEYIKPYENVEWKTKEEEIRFNEIIGEVENSEDVIFDDFYMYENLD